ncbi:hypothetical protein GCM10012319_30160 [Comamonas sp. KCTC 72670]|nr:hypothetical protein GCM10012319_30160 [Comamonas sp. KCTC 72670]
MGPDWASARAPRAAQRHTATTAQALAKDSQAPRAGEIGTLMGKSGPLEKVGEGVNQHAATMNGVRAVLSFLPPILFVRHHNKVKPGSDNALSQGSRV